MPLVTLSFLAVAAIASTLFYYTTRPAALRPVGQAKSVPVDARFIEGRWWWIERGDKPPGRLVSADSRGVRDVVRVDQVQSYDVEGDSVAYLGKAGQRAVLTSIAAGSSPVNLWTGSGTTTGLQIHKGAAFWLEAAEGPLPESPFPGLSGTTRIWTVPLKGGPPRAVAKLLEAQPGEVIGLQGEDVLVSAYRPGTPGSMVIYAVNLESGNARRLLGEEGRGRAIVGSDQSIYWVCASPESAVQSADIAVRRRRPDGRIDTLLDWISPGGEIHFSNGRPYLVTDQPDGRIWPAESASGLPTPLPIPGGHFGIAVGGGRGLIGKYESPAAVALYEVALK